MDTIDNSGQNNMNTGRDNTGGQPQGVDPNSYPPQQQYPYGQIPQQQAPPQQVLSQQVPQQQWFQQQGDQVAGVPVQQQLMAGASSPEMPATQKSQESLTSIEFAEHEKVAEKHEKEKLGSNRGEKDTVIKASDSAPEQRKFESPFKNVYGYQVSQKAALSGKKGLKTNVKGDTSSAKTWLVILLGRLLKIYRGGEYKIK